MISANDVNNNNTFFGKYFIILDTKPKVTNNDSMSGVSVASLIIIKESCRAIFGLVSSLLF